MSDEMINVERAFFTGGSLELIIDGERYYVGSKPSFLDDGAVQLTHMETHQPHPECYTVPITYEENKQIYPLENATRDVVIVILARREWLERNTKANPYKGEVPIPSVKEAAGEFINPSPPWKVHDWI